MWSETQKNIRWVRAIPVGIGVNKTTILFGKLPIRFGAEVHYSAIQPDDAGQTWLFRIYAVPVVPSPFAG